MGNSVTLHSACAYGDLNAVRTLLQTTTPAELEAKDDNGRTPLLVAVAGMSYKPDDDDDDEDDDPFGDNYHDDHSDTDDTEYHDAQDGSDAHSASADNSSSEPALSSVDTSQQRQQQSHQVTDEPENDTDNAPQRTTTEQPLSKRAEILALLLEQHVNLDHQDDSGWTALHHACFAQSAAAIQMLIHSGAHPMREKFGLLPQDFLLRGQSPESVATTQDLKETLDAITDASLYAIQLLAFRPSGIVQLDLGGQVEQGSLVTIEYDVPATHSLKDYVQVLLSTDASSEITIGSYHFVPAGKHGQLTISTQSIPSGSTIRCVYVKCDINTMSRQVVASGCNAVVQASVGEIFQYELYLYERVVEVESIPEFEFLDQPLIVLKRIGIVRPASATDTMTTDNDANDANDANTTIEWVAIRPDNHIVAVNDIRIDSMEFTEAVRVLQENNGKKCTKLLMQNYSACGDFIPEKILGIGVIGTFAYLNPLEENDAALDIDKYDRYDDHDVIVEQNLDAWVRQHRNSSSNECATSTVATLAQPPAANDDNDNDNDNDNAALENRNDPSCGDDDFDDNDALERKRRLCNGDSDDPANVVSAAKISAKSTIETVVSLQNSMQLVEQLQQGISISRKQA